MAKTVNDYQEMITASLSAAQDLDALEVLTPEEVAQEQPTSTSIVAQWRKLVYAVALCAHFIDTLIEEATARMEVLIASQRVHKISWYQEQALRFQYGMATDANGYYNNTGLDDDAIAAMRVFKYAAITRTVQQGAIILRCKVAGDDGSGNLVQNSQAEIAAGQAFMTDNSDAGTNLILTSGAGDDLKVTIDVYFDPQVLDSEGKRLDGTNDTPVLQATQAFLKEIEFNDTYVKTFHTDAIQRVNGVRIPVIKYAASKYGVNGYDTDTVENAGVIDQLRVADSGYFKLDLEATVINYIPYE